MVFPLSVEAKEGELQMDCLVQRIKEKVETAPLGGVSQALRLVVENHIEK